MKTVITLALTAAAALISAQPALAQDAAGSGQLVVSYSDLDLGTRSGVRTFDRRIRSAVESVCGPISSFDPRGRIIVRDCRAETLALARAQRDVAIAQAASGAPVVLAAQR
jgi:UrcA family protein